MYNILENDNVFMLIVILYYNACNANRKILPVMVRTEHITIRIFFLLIMSLQYKSKKYIIYG